MLLKTKCTLCGYEYDESKAEEACKNCPLKKGCKLIKCPNCSFETPPEPKWIKYLKKARNSNESR